MLRVGLCAMAIGGSSAAFVRPCALRAAAACRIASRPLMSAAETEVKSFLETALNAMGASAVSGDGATIDKWLKDYCADEGFFVRPSGNPLSFGGLKEMWTAPYVTVTKSDLVSIDSIKVFADGKAAVATYTMHDQFEYKGTPNDDYAKNTAVLEKVGDSWVWIQGHRGSGQPPPL